MKVLLYFALTINGFIARINGDSDWVSKANEKDFFKTCREYPAIIFGRRTFDILYPDFLPLSKSLHVVFTHRKAPKLENFIFTNKSPVKVLGDLRERGIKKALIFGGSNLASQFLKQKLVDEIKINFESLIFGSGIPLLNLESYESRLELLGVKNLSSQTVQLHYKVQK